MSFKYAVLGAGRQGIAAAYDLGRFGDAEKILLVDVNAHASRKGASRINKLLKKRIAQPVTADMSDTGKLAGILKGTDALISAVPYKYNLELTKLAIKIRACMTDLGGNTAVVRKQLSLNAKAKKAGITIVPDCGMGPGLNISLADYVMSLVDNPREIRIWDGGLPQKPKAPWNYALFFHINGLSNEYYGNAYFLRNNKITEVPCFEDQEDIDFPPFGKLEAFVTSGGLSTAPWSFRNKLELLENKTIRYPGHCAQFKAFSQLGLLGLEPINAGKNKIVPRDAFHALLEPRINLPDTRDVCLMRVKCTGEKSGRPAEATAEIIDYFDEKTGFRAMERLTGWHASIMAILAAHGKIAKGAVSVELAVPGKTIVEEIKKRGINVSTYQN